MANVEGPRKMQPFTDDLLHGTFLDPLYDDNPLEEFAHNGTWDAVSLAKTPLQQQNEVNIMDSTWNFINAWLFDNEITSEDFKTEPFSPFNGSSSSQSSENEVDADLITIATNSNLDPDAFFNQPHQAVVTKSDCLTANMNIQSEVAGLPIGNNTLAQINPSLTESQLKVYQKFVPIKPKCEPQDFNVEKPLFENHSVSKTPKCQLETIQKTSGGNEERVTLQVKRKIRTESDAEQRFSRKQKRLARNRESALQSRQRKKELMQTLEVRLNALSDINSQLKNENDALKDKIKELENENLELKHKRQIDVPDLAKKTSCVLVLFVFLAVNMKPLSNISSSMHDSAQLYNEPIRHGRFLLEYDKKAATEEPVVYHNSVYNKAESRLLQSETLMDVLDRKVLRKIKRLYKLQGLMKKERLPSVGVTQKKGNESHDDCSLSFNKTEVYRLNEALEKLVKLHKKKARKLKKNKTNEKPGKLSALKNFLAQPANCTTNQRNNTSNCSRKVSPKLIASFQSKSQTKRANSNHVTKSNEVQTFQYDWSVFERFQKSINRQPDTFYFVSFRKDHILLPPLHYNETQRPRVSFILPSSNSSHSIWNSTGDKVSLMQIDCQVMDTKIFHILKSNIPRYNLPFSSFFLKQT